MIDEASSHRWRDSECLMNFPEIVPHEVQGDRMLLVSEFLRKGVGEPCIAPHAHSHREIVPLCKGRRDMDLLGVAHDPHLARPATFSRTIAGSCISIRRG